MLKHCKSCVWAQECGGVTYCPWGAGMCVKVKGSFDSPDEFRLRKRILRTEYGIDPTENKESKPE